MICATATAGTGARTGLPERPLVAVVADDADDTPVGAVTTATESGVAIAAGAGAVSAAGTSAATPPEEGDAVGAEARAAVVRPLRVDATRADDLADDLADVDLVDDVVEVATVALAVPASIGDARSRTPCGPRAGAWRTSTATSPGRSIDGTPVATGAGGAASGWSREAAGATRAATTTATAPATTVTHVRSRTRLFVVACIPTILNLYCPEPCTGESATQVRNAHCGAFATLREVSSPPRGTSNSGREDRDDLDVGRVGEGVHEGGVGEPVAGVAEQRHVPRERRCVAADQDEDAR